MPDSLPLLVRTPHAEILRREVVSLRVPTDTGFVGFLPGAERAVLAVEPGLAIARDKAGREVLIATAGGILRLEREVATLLSAMAVVGEDAKGVCAAMDALASEPSAEMELRRRIDTLERGLLSQSQRTRPARQPRAPEGR